MKALLLIGVLLAVLGIVSFFVPFPHSEHHGVSVGDAHVGITTEHDEKVAPAVRVAKRNSAQDLSGTVARSGWSGLFHAI